MPSLDTVDDDLPSKRPRRSPKKKPAPVPTRRAPVTLPKSPRVRREGEDGEIEPDLPAFVSKLYQIAVTEQSPYLIWVNDNTSFRITDQDVSFRGMMN